MKTFIVRKEQIIEYVERKKSEKIFESIIVDIYNTNKLLNENISRNKASQDIINKYKKNKMITPRVEEMLIKFKIMKLSSNFIFSH
jgi:hypothetical protein